LLNHRYQIVKTLGRGGFGQTFLAVDTHLPSQRSCAIKQLKPAIANPAQKQWLEDRFEREAAILEALGAGHPQIPQLYAYFQENGEFYLVQEYIEGETLTQQVQQKGAFAVAEVEQLLISLLQVLEYVHSQHKIHRDIKPDNIIIRASDSQPVLIDFGAVKEAVTTVAAAGENASVAIGTPGFMASEQAAGRPIYSSDLYSLGLTAVFLLSGKLPHTLAADSQSGELLWRQALPNLHANLTTVLDRAIRYHPRDRYATAGEMLQALLNGGSIDSTAETLVVAPGEAAIPASVGTSQPTRAVSSPPTAQKSSSRWFVGLGLGVAAAIAILSYSLIAQNDKPDPVAISTPTPTPSPSPTPTPSPSPTPTPSPSPTPTPSPSPTPSPTPTPTPSPSPTPPPQRNDAPVPVFPLGTSQRQIIEALGEPTDNRKGYFPNTRALAYNNYLAGEANLGFIFDSNSGRLRQSEVSFEASVAIAPIEATLNELLEGNFSTVARQSLQTVYHREADLRSFSVGDFKGMIQRDRRDRLYLAVWERTFH
jgi:serine/threonine-protein kinase